MSSDVSNVKNHIPVDRGYAWVILFASHVVSFLYVGILNSSGIFFIEYIEAFKSSASMTSLVSGMQTGFNAIALLPVMVFGIQKYTVRQCVIVGGCLISLSFILSSFATSIEYLIFSNSFLFGIGGAFIWSPSMVIIAKYFEKRRGFANGTYLAASCLGSSVFPFFLRFVLDTYGLSGGLLLTGGVLLNTVTAGCLQRPPEFYTRTESVAVNLQECQNPILIRPGNAVDIHSNKTHLNVNSMDTSTALSSSQPLLITPGNGDNNISYRAWKLSSFSNNSEPCVTENVSKIENNLHLSHTEFASIADLSIKKIFQKGKNEELYGKTNSTLRDIMTSVCDRNVIFNKSLLLFLSAFCFGSINGILSYVYIPKFASENGIDLFSSTSLVSIMGATDLVGRLTSGMLSDCRKIPNHHIIIGSQLLASVVVHLSRFCHGYLAFVAFSSMFGLFSGMLFSLYPVIIADILGKDKLPVGLALAMISQGITLTVTSPLLGFLRDVTGTYHATFHYVGTTSFISAILLIFIPCIGKKTEHIIEEKIIDCE